MARLLLGIRLAESETAERSALLLPRSFVVVLLRFDLLESESENQRDVRWPLRMRSNTLRS